MNRGALDATHTVALALLGMVTYQRTYDGKRIVRKQHLCGGLQLIILKKTDHLRDIGADRTALPALWILALKTTIGFL